MISIDFVNGTKSLDTELMFRPYEKFYESCLNEVDQDLYEFSMLQEKIAIESEILGPTATNRKYKVMYEEAKPTIFQKIGDALIKIFNAFSKLIDTFCDKIKELSFKRKSDVQKLDALIKKHPEFKNEVVAAFNSGALSASDCKSLKELDTTFNEVLRMAKKEEIDTKTLRGKWEKAKENFEKDEKSWKIVKIAGAAVTIISAALAIKTFIPKCNKAVIENRKDKDEMRQARVDAYNTLTSENLINDTTGKREVIRSIYLELTGKHAQIRKENMSMIDKMSMGIAKLADKIEDKVSSGKSTKNFHSNMKHVNDLNERKKQNQLDMKRAEAKASAQGRAEGEREDYINNKKFYKDKASDIAYQQSKGKKKFDDNHVSISGKRKDAWDSEIGKRRAAEDWDNYKNNNTSLRNPYQNTP